MNANRTSLDRSDYLKARARELYGEQQHVVHCQTDRLFAWVLAAEWLMEIATALWISPYTWVGSENYVHAHVWTATMLGFVIVSVPIALALLFPGRASTRHAIAIAQALTSAVLIHLTGGRIETHFHVFGSLALLALYRDWRVLLSASFVVAADHFVRGIVWPESVYGTALASPWRFAEHAGWVLVEDVFLFLFCKQSLSEMGNVAERQARLEETNDAVSAANNHLREEIAQRQAAQLQLERAKEAAEAANRAKSEFLANMSHELRTPLNAVIGFSDILAEQVFGPLTEQQQQYVSDILESGQHLLSLVNDILDLAKIESGSLDLELGQVDLPAFIERTAHMFREKALRQGISLVCETDRNLSVIADERRLKQVLYNLLSNAIKFTPEGGRIAVRVARQGEHVLISVADTGVGIAREEQQKIFETFYQVDSTLTKTKQGTGLGLALVRSIADLHDGHVWVESALGEGSEFFFSLPMRACADEVPGTALVVA